MQTKIQNDEKRYHAEKLNKAIAITIQTKYPEIISANLAMGAFDPCAS